MQELDVWSGIDKRFSEAEKRLTALEAKTDARLCSICEGSGVLHYQDNDNCPNCDGTGTKPDKLRAACEELDAYNIEHINLKANFPNLVTLVRAIKSALSDDAPEEVLEDLTLKTHHMKEMTFFVYDDEGNLSPSVEIYNVRQGVTQDGIACGLSAKQVEAIHKWTDAWLAKMDGE